MSKYGSKTRVTEAVSLSGQRNDGSSSTGYRLYEETFTSPGTWTKPPTVTSVEVFVVGGGGGGMNGNVNPASTSTPPVGPFSTSVGGGGGGGGVNWGVVPVSGPVPITVGAGGVPTKTFTAPIPSVNPLLPGANGGLSSFGPTVPGFPYPSTNVVAGGGFGGLLGVSPSLPSDYNQQIAGGAGGYGVAPGLSQQNSLIEGGDLGFDVRPIYFASPTEVASVGGGGAGSTAMGAQGGMGVFGYGTGAPSSGYLAGGGGTGSPINPNYVPTGTPLATDGEANTGGGGGAGVGVGGVFWTSPIAGSPQAGGSGGSGVVIVRYWA